MDGMLSQEEINALLGGTNNTDNSKNKTNTAFLTEEESDAIGEISNICMGTASTTLYSLVNQKVLITTPVVDISTWDELTKDYTKPFVFVNIYYREGIDGNNVLILQQEDVKVITDLMMGGDGLNVDFELSELHFSAICEAMNQMMGSASTSLSSMLNRRIDISPPVAELADFNNSLDESKFPLSSEKEFVKVSFNMTIGELVDSTIMQLYPIAFAKDLFNIFTKEIKQDDSEEPVVNNNNSKISNSKKEEIQFENQDLLQNSNMMNPEMMNQGMMNQGMMNPGMMNPGMMNQGMMNPGMMNQGMMNPGMMNQGMMNPGMMNQGMMNPGMMNQMPNYGYMQQDINAKNVKFQAFNPNIGMALQQENIDLIMDVPLEVSVVLGRTRKSIKEILEFAPGTIIELDKLAGEPVDIMVNAKLVAKGEVVVIEESFGIRITDIIKEK